MSCIRAGTDRENPARVDCPADRWGYPCFRKDAVPIVIWVTDAPLTNGPPTLEGNLGPENNFFFTSTSTLQPMNWGVANTRIDTATSSAYFQVPSTNDTYDTAYDIGSINESFRTYTGDSTLLTANLTTALAGACIGGTTRSKGPAAWDTTAQTAPDAYFKFRVDVAEPLTISTRGGHVKSSLAIVDAARKTTTSAAATATNANSTAPNALSLGTINPLTTTSVVTGTTASGSAVFTRDVFGSCLAQNTASSDKVAAGVVKFRLANDLPGGLRVSGDANYALATAVYAGPPGIPADTALTSVNVQPGPSSTAATTGGNANDVYDSFNVGDLAGRYVRLTSGTTSTANLTSNFASSFFTASPACSAVTGSGVDAVVDFTLSTPTRVRLEGLGANATLTAGFDHVIALVPRTSIAHTAASNNYTDLTAQAVNLSEVPAAASDGSEYTGVLGGTPSDYLQTEVGPFATATAATACTNAAAAASTTSQAVFVMDVTNATAGTYDFETGGSAASTWLSLHRTLADTQQQVVATNPINAGQVQDLGAIDDRSVFVQAATLAGHGTANADFTVRSAMGCTGSPTANGGVDAIYSFRVTSSRSVQVGAVGGAATNVASNPGLPGFNAHLAVFAGAISAANIVSGGCDDPSGNGYTGTAFTALPNVTYYVVVKQLNTATTYLTGTAAAYGLWLRDVNFANSFVSCNYGSQVNYPTSVRASRVTAALTAGRYYAVIKGTAASAYKFNVRRHNSVTPSIIACDRNSGGTLHSVIEQDLAAGKYAVIIRGVSTSDAGTYNLTLRDTGFAAVPIACSYDGNTGTPTSILTSALPATRNGTPIDYYAAVRGNTATGAYTMYLENGAFQPTQCAFDNCYWTHNDPNTNTQRYNFDLNNGEWTGTLQPGDYYAIVKGEDMTDVATNTEDDDFGRYQLSIGDSANHTGIADFGPKTWLGPAGDGVGGIRQELLDRKIRVVTVDSTRGPNDTVAGTNDPYYSNQQMQTVARETNAVHADGSPLFYTLNSDGSGLGSAIVQGVQEVSGNLAMDVTARLVEDPDRPSPHFGFTVEAVDMPGDSCGPPIDTDHDAAHIPDTHVACTAGATPKFRVTFSNPLPPNNIADNPNDPNGGYNMRVELIGDDQFVIDKVPVYVVPENLIADPGDALFAPVGRYVQDSNSSGCAGTESPLWTTLSWEDSLPRNTSLGWEICTADTQTELDSCSYRTLATVTRGATCVTSATCPNGYCTAGGYCEYAAGPACSAANDCGAGGVCAAGRCAWLQNPIDFEAGAHRRRARQAFHSHAAYHVRDPHAHAGTDGLFMGSEVHVYTAGMKHTSASPFGRSSRRVGVWSLLFLAVACGNNAPPGSGSGIVPDDDADVDGADDAGTGDAAAADSGSGTVEDDAGPLSGDGNCEGEVFTFDGVRSQGRRLSLLVAGDTAHLVYPTPSCGGSSSRSPAQAISYVQVGLKGAPSAPRVLVNGSGCFVSRDPALYTEGDAVRVLYTTNAPGSYDLCSADTAEGGADVKRITDSAGNEVDTAVATLGGVPRAFFSRENSSSTNDDAAPIVSVANAQFNDTLSADTKVRALDIVASQLLDGTSLGAIAFPSAMSSAPGLYLSLVDAAGKASGAPTLLSSALGAGGAAALASNDDGGAVIYSEVPGGTAQQMRFRSIARDGTVGEAVKITTANQDLRDLAFAPFHGGYLAAYRRTSAAEGLSASMRLLFIDEVGNVKMTGYVGDASSTGGTTQLGVAQDGNTFFIAWSNAESVADDSTGVASVVERVSVARFSCTTVPKLTCDG